MPPRAIRTGIIDHAHRAADDPALRSLDVFKTLLLPVGLLIALVAALLAPRPGVAMSGGIIVFVFVSLMFFVNGWQTDIKSLAVGKRLAGAIALTAVFTFVAGPAIGYAIVHSLNFDPEIATGIIVMASMAPTLSSVVVITAQAHGNRAWAILLTVCMNLLGIFVIPLLLAFLLDNAAVSLPVTKMFIDLVLSVLLPFIAGVILRHFSKAAPRGWLNLLPTFCVIALSYMSFSTGRPMLLASSIGTIALLIVTLLAMHLVLLAMSVGSAVLLGYRPAEQKAIGFINSQKTLPVAVSILASLGQSTGAAAVPCVIFHLTQILCDSAVASRWHGKSHENSPKH